MLFIDSNRHIFPSPMVALSLVACSADSCSNSHLEVKHSINYPKLKSSQTSFPRLDGASRGPDLLTFFQWELESFGVVFHGYASQNQQLCLQSKCHTPCIEGRTH